MSNDPEAATSSASAPPAPPSDKKEPNPLIKFIKSVFGAKKRSSSSSSRNVAPPPPPAMNDQGESSATLVDVSIPSLEPVAPTEAKAPSVAAEDLLPAYTEHSYGYEPEHESEFDLPRAARALENAQDLLAAIATGILVRDTTPAAAVIDGALAQLRALVGASPFSDLDFSRDLAQPYLTALVSHAVLAAVAGWFPTDDDGHGQAKAHARAVWHMVATHVATGEPMPRAWSEAVAAVAARVRGIFAGLELTRADDAAVHDAVVGSVLAVAAVRAVDPRLALHWIPAGGDVQSDYVRHPVPTIASKYVGDGEGEEEEALARVAFTTFPRIVVPADLEVTGGEGEDGEWRRMFRAAVFAYEVTPADAAAARAAAPATVAAVVAEPAAPTVAAAATVVAPVAAAVALATETSTATTTAEAEAAPTTAAAAPEADKPTTSVAEDLASLAVAAPTTASPEPPKPALTPSAAHPLANPNSPMYAMPVPAVLTAADVSAAAVPDADVPPSVAEEDESEYDTGVPQLTMSDLEAAYEEREEQNREFERQMEMHAGLYIANQMMVQATYDMADGGFDG
ncbi:hypothetical protein H9P43_004058 [Blastocladiella emersonii ATCC 22665]|nr:hypothetical protein H9P43_004058 [Blastocladiella emersonii ATCC 22665]